MTLGGSPVVVLLSGGLDSVTVLAIASARGHRVHALSFGYGQRHAVELDCARRQARRFEAAAHEIVDLAHLGALVAPATALVASSDLQVPKRAAYDPAASSIPPTYVPARNTIFLAYALAWAEVIGSDSIFIGVNALDYSGYPDCRPAFIEAFEHMANLATRAGTERGAIHIEAPLQHLRKHEIIALGVEHGVDHADTVSCYDPVVRDARPRACGRCDSCRLRREGFARAGVSDPTSYV
jgi:7-cyano-7-deazaguanine synthase